MPEVYAPFGPPYMAVHEMSHQTYQDWLYRQPAERRMHEVAMTLHSLALAVEERQHPRGIRNLQIMCRIAHRAYTRPFGARYV